MFRRAAALAKEHGYHERGYRTVFNTNREAGQTVFHIHLHLLAGRGLTWPPGLTVRLKPDTTGSVQCPASAGPQSSAQSTGRG